MVPEGVPLPTPDENVGPGRAFRTSGLRRKGTEMIDRLIGLSRSVCGPCPACLGLAAVVASTVLWCSGTSRAADAPTAFTGEKTDWHGFDRYDFLMDEQSLAIASAAAGPAASGQRRCIVVAPRQPAPGYPWSWRGCYWDHQPQTEIELLRR